MLSQLILQKFSVLHNILFSIRFPSWVAISWNKIQILILECYPFKLHTFVFISFIHIFILYFNNLKNYFYSKNLPHGGSYSPQEQHFIEMVQASISSMAPQGPQKYPEIRKGRGPLTQLSPFLLHLVCS